MRMKRKFQKNSCYLQIFRKLMDNFQILRWLPTVFAQTTLMHKNDSQTIILRGMRMKFSLNIRDIILKILQ